MHMKISNILAKIKLFSIHFSTYKNNNVINLVYLDTHSTIEDTYGLENFNFLSL